MRSIEFRLIANSPSEIHDNPRGDDLREFGRLDNPQLPSGGYADAGNAVVQRRESSRAVQNDQHNERRHGAADIDHQERRHRRLYLPRAQRRGADQPHCPRYNCRFDT